MGLVYEKKIKQCEVKMFNKKLKKKIKDYQKEFGIADCCMDCEFLSIEILDNEIIWMECDLNYCIKNTKIN